MGGSRIGSCGFDNNGYVTNTAKFSICHVPVVVDVVDEVQRTSINFPSTCRWDISHLSMAAPPPPPPPRFIHFFSKSNVTTNQYDAPTIRVTQDYLIHSVDLIRTFCSIKQKAATEAISRLPDELFPKCNFIKRRMGTAGNYTNLLNVENAISLIMVIPGKMAVETRRDFAKIIVRHFAGDQYLEMETKANGISTSGLAALAQPSSGLVEDHADHAACA